MTVGKCHLKCLTSLKQKIIWTGFILSLTGFVLTDAAVKENLLQDPGFESLALDSSPNVGDTPWNTTEAEIYEIRRWGTNPHSGQYNLAFQYYAPAKYISQKIGVQIEANTDYELSVWIRLSTASTSASQTNASSINMALATSATVDGTYNWIGVGQKNNMPTVPDEWQKFTVKITADLLVNYVGEWIEIRFKKETENSQYRIWLDDASFGKFLPPISLIVLSTP